MADVQASSAPTDAQAPNPSSVPYEASGWGTEDKRRADVARKAFESFGYTPTDEEVSSISNAFGYGQARGVSAIASYVTAVKNMQNAEANNPLKQVFADEKGFFNDTQMKAGQTFDQAISTTKQPPKLFGGLTPEQIDQYLAPATQAARAGSANLEGAYARRGLAGSNVEANALADSNRQYKENVLSTGLQIGLSDQAKQQEMLANLSQLLYGQLPGLQGQIQGTAGTLSDQSRSDAALKSSLLPYFSASVQQNRATDDAMVAQRAAYNKASQSNKNFFAPGMLGDTLVNQGATYLMNDFLENLTGQPAKKLFGAGNNPTQGATGVPNDTAGSPGSSLFGGSGGLGKVGTASNLAALF